MKYIFYTIPIMLLLANMCIAQWQTDVRLTNDPAFSGLTYGISQAIATRGDTVHVVWSDERDGNREIYYKRSTDEGAHWGPDARLTNSPDTSTAASIAIVGACVHVVWQDKRDGNYEIYYKRSSDCGMTWGEDTRLTNDPARSQTASISASDSTVHILWVDYRAASPGEYYLRSTDNGVRWEPGLRVSDNTPYFALNGSIACSGPIVHIAWNDYRDGNSEIYYKRSTDGGGHWGPDRRLTFDQGTSQLPSIAVSGSLVHIVWWDNRDGDDEIYYMRSPDNGTTWEDDTRLTNHPGISSWPSVIASNKVIHAFWKDTREGKAQIFHKRSTDAGGSWGEDVRVSHGAGTSDRPTGAASGTIVHVLWMDDRDGNSEVYYNRNLSGNLVAVGKPNGTLLDNVSISRIYPNPGNTITTVEFAIGRAGYTTVQIFNVSGTLVRTLVSEALHPGVHNALWDASNVPSGLYLFKLSSGGLSVTRQFAVVR
jgi:hypothetical protein